MPYQALAPVRRFFPTDKPVIIDNIVISMESKGENWTFESNPPSWYRKVGISRADFAKALGQTVIVEGVRAKDGAAFGYMQKIKLPDGTTFELVNAAETK